MQHSYITLIYTALMVLSYSDLCLPQPAATRAGEIGAPFVEHYSTRDLGYDVTNWSCARDTRGILWVGNSFGLLEYDGVSWRIIESANNTPVYSVACGGDGTIYFGLRGAFGRLVFDAVGRPQMELLSDLLPADTPPLTEFYQIHVLGSTAYFVSGEALCSWDGAHCTAYPSTHLIGRSFASQGHIYAQLQGAGLAELMDNEFELLPGGDLFATYTPDDTKIYPPERIISLYHDDEGRLIVGSRLRGMYRQEGRTFENIWTFDGIDDPLWMPTRGLRLPNGNLAMGTTHSGIYIFDDAGVVQTVIDRSTGLIGGDVQSLCVDADNIIWAALDDGLARIEWPGGPLTRFGSARGMFGQVTALRRFAGSIFAASTQGLFVLSPALGQSRARRDMNFQLIPSVRSTVYDLLDVGDALLVSTTYGVHAMNAAQTLRRIAPHGARALLPLHGSRDTILAGYHRGLSYLIRSGSQWRVQTLTDRLEDFVLSLAEDANGCIWVTTAQHGVRRIDPEESRLPTRIHDFGTSDGLPAGPIFVATVHGRPVFINEERTLAFDAKSKRFVPDTAFLGSFPDPLPYEPKFLSEDGKKRIWMQLFETQSLGFATQQSDDTYRFTAAPFLGITGDVIAVQTDDDGVCWFGTDDAVYRYDPSARHRSHRPFRTLIRRLTADGSSLYEGDLFSPRDTTFTIPPDAQRITIAFASGNVFLEGSMLYRWRLEGADSSWSTPAPWHSAEYGSLPPGDYVFHVQAMIPGDIIGDETRIAFTVSHHWYQRWWMLVLFVLGILLVVLAARALCIVRRNPT